MVRFAAAFMRKKGREPKPARQSAQEKHQAVPSSTGLQRPMTILFGSQTGTAEGFATTLMREARARGYAARTVDLDDLSQGELSRVDGLCIFLLATYGEGEPTDNAIAFHRWANNDDRSPDSLAAIQYAAFGLGNTQYKHYNYMGKWVDKRLKELGAERLVPLGLGDGDGDIDADFEAWRAALWTALPGAAAADQPVDGVDGSTKKDEEGKTMLLMHKLDLVDGFVVGKPIVVTLSVFNKGSGNAYSLIVRDDNWKSDTFRVVSGANHFTLDYMNAGDQYVHKFTIVPTTETWHRIHPAQIAYVYGEDGESTIMASNTLPGIRIAAVGNDKLAEAAGGADLLATVVPEANGLSSCSCAARLFCWAEPS